MMSPRKLLLPLCAILLLGSAETPQSSGAPKVTVTVTAERSSLQTRGGFGSPATIEPLRLALVVNNESDCQLTGLRLALPPGGEVSVTAEPRFPAAIEPYGSFTGHVTLQPKASVDYGHHDLLLAVEFRWSAGGRSFSSSRTAPVAFDVKRPFEEEAKGLPGGTAALFWLLLPVLPAFFAYEIVDRWRRGEGFQVPSFGAEYVLPAFVIGLAVSAMGVDQSRWSVLLAAAAVGALWPAARWSWDAVQQRRWGFRENDSDIDYLHKLLLSPRAPRRFYLVTGEKDGKAWSGVRLEQPDGRLVLGSSLQLTPGATDRKTIERLLSGISGDNWRRCRRELDRLIRSRAVTVGRLHTVEPLKVIATDDLAGFTTKEVVATDVFQLTH